MKVLAEIDRRSPQAVWTKSSLYPTVLEVVRNLTTDRSQVANRKLFQQAISNLVKSDTRSVWDAWAVLGGKTNPSDLFGSSSWLATRMTETVREMENVSSSGVPNRNSVRKVEALMTREIAQAMRRPDRYGLGLAMEWSNARCRMLEHLEQNGMSTGTLDGARREHQSIVKALTGAHAHSRAGVLAK
jgi:hypothetical protein